MIADIPIAGLSLVHPSPQTASWEATLEEFGAFHDRQLESRLHRLRGVLAELAVVERGFEDPRAW